MTTAHHRQKQPEQVRERLLTVAQDLLIEKGAHAVTLDAVSRQAGVSKGGLQYHFRSKSVLLDALSDQLFTEFDQQYEYALSIEPAAPERYARAYIRTSFDSANRGNSVKMQRAIAQLALALPHCRERWNAKMKAALVFEESDPMSAARLFICRLAADGFWLAQMFDIYDIDEQKKQSTLQNLLNLCSGLPLESSLHLDESEHDA